MSSYDNFFQNSKLWMISLKTLHQPCSYDAYLCFYTLMHMPSKVLRKQCRVWLSYTNLASLHKMLISSEAMRHPIRILDTFLEHQKAILSIFESRRNIRVNLGNTWSISVDSSVDQNLWKDGYYAHIWARVVLKYEFLWPIFFRNSKIWIISFQTHYQPCSYGGIFRVDL